MASSSLVWPQSFLLGIAIFCTGFGVNSQEVRHYETFFTERMCHPGYTGINCSEPLRPANPWYTADCPNLQASNSLDVNVSLESLGGRVDCPPMKSSRGLPLPYCAYLCYSHPVTGTAVVPSIIWRMAQKAEQHFWKGQEGNGDRVAEQIDGFRGYRALRGLHLGDMIEVGSGPWTQTRGLLRAVRGASKQVTSLTLYEPGAQMYMNSVPSCAYRTGKLMTFHRKGYHAFPLRIIGQGGERLLTHTAQYDTLVAINVIEHVQNAFHYLEGLHRVIKPGGLLVWHERYHLDVVKADRPLGRNLFHPIRVSQRVLDVFLDQFNIIFKNDDQTEAMKARKANETPYFVIARKK